MFSGKRISDNRTPKRPGGYSKNDYFLWRVVAPNGASSIIHHKNIIEHDDGTITSRISLFIQGSDPRYWRGRIERGNWIESDRESTSKHAMKII